MNATDYPEKIYAYSEEPNKAVGDYDAGNIHDVEYTRSDLVPKWHKYPDEQPKENDIYLALTNQGGYYILEYVDDGESWKWYDGLQKFELEVAYWQELSKPKEYSYESI